MRVDDAFVGSVVFLGVRAGQQFIPHGTGFLVAIPLGGDVGRAMVYLVTARHVVESMRGSKLPHCVRMNTRHSDVTLANLGGEWVTHPTDVRCDIAVTGFSAPTELIDYRVLDIQHGSLTTKYIHENDIGPGDEVFTTGLLVSHFGEKRNVPVVRVGNIATMPGEPVDLGPVLGKQEVYLIESRSIGGLSGSPVFLPTPPQRLVNGKLKDMGGHRRGYLIGVNIGLFETSAHGDSVPVEVEEKRQRFLETMSAGIAVVVPIQRVTEIIDSGPFKVIRDGMVTNDGP